ncbi:hypothetical protein [Gallibacterium salpingitidis]|uniref:DUF1318 domain-containing protein n=1 Tax=Gallibacterium salpingitidis TaxID=505341 RepID=A0A1A7NQI1_9PAST|nr:hypothetical protein [Gallibacterium salpingitidis]OBW91888.1 hypothetical protein QS62_10010 [Gallibacterium salpingitidis]
MLNTKLFTVLIGFSVLCGHAIADTASSEVHNSKALNIENINKSIQEAYSGQGEGAKALESQQKAYTTIYNAIKNTKLTDPAKKEMNKLSKQEQEAINKSMDGWTESRKNRWQHSGGRVDILEDNK